MSGRVNVARVERYGHRLGASPEGAHRAAGKEVVGAETRYGEARQQEHKAVLEPAKAGWATGPHRDSMDGKLAMRGEKHRRQVFHADARAARHDHDIRLGTECAQDGLISIGNDAGEIDKPPVALHERGKHRSVCIDKPVSVWLRTAWQQFVAGDDQPDSRLAKDLNLARADRAEDTHVLWPQDAVGFI